MKYIPVDQYFRENHFEDCKVPQSVCVVDYAEQYKGDEPEPEYSVKDIVSKLEQKIKEVIRDDKRS